MNEEYQRMAANAICHAAEQAGNVVQSVAWEYGRPSTVHKPRLFIDGNQWCALYGENVQDGVSGFGRSPNDAYADFDKNWNKPLEV